MQLTANDPRLALVPDPKVREMIARQSMMKGLGDLGISLLSQSGYGRTAPTLGEAFGNALPTFQKSLNDNVGTGINVDETARKAIAEKQRIARLNELIPSAVDPVGAEFGLLNDNAGLQTQSFKKPDPDTSGGGASSEASIKRLLNNEAAGIYGGDVDPVTGAFRVFDENRADARDIADEAMRLYKSGQAGLHNATRLAAKKLKVNLTDLEKVNPTNQNTNFSDLRK